MKRLLYLLATLLAPIHVSAQMLFSENMTMSIDSTKTLQGTISPSLNFQTEKENVFTFRNSANINLLIKRSRVINLINKFEFSTYGKKVTLSGGYIHAEFLYSQPTETPRKGRPQRHGPASSGIQHGYTHH